MARDYRVPNNRTPGRPLNGTADLANRRDWEHQAKVTKQVGDQADQTAATVATLTAATYVNSLNSKTGVVVIRNPDGSNVADPGDGTLKVAAGVPLTFSDGATNWLPTVAGTLTFGKSTLTTSGTSRTVTVSDATNSQTGLIQLSGVLTGTAASPALNSLIGGGTYTNPTVTVGADGRVTAIVNGAAPSGTGSGGVSKPPYWKVDGYQGNSFGSGRTIDQTYFTGANLPAGKTPKQWIQNATGLDGSLQYEGAVNWVLKHRLAFQNTGASSITAQIYVPATNADLNLLYTRTSPTPGSPVTLVSSTSTNTEQTASLSLAAGEAGFLTAFSYNSGGAFILSVITNLLLQSGVAFWDADTLAPPAATGYTIQGTPTTGQGVIYNGSAYVPASVVTSVAQTVPGFLSVAGSPITSSGTLAISLVPQGANTVFAGPVSGAAANPTFRALVAADLPTVDRNVVFTTGTQTTYAMAPTDDVVVCVPNSGVTCTVTLPSANSVQKFRYVRNRGAGTVLCVFSGSDTGEASITASMTTGQTLHILNETKSPGFWGAYS